MTKVGNGGVAQLMQCQRSPDLLDRRSANAERAMDSLRKKFGQAAVIRGIAYEGPEKAGDG